MQTGSGLSEQRVVYNPLGNPTRVSWSDGSGCGYGVFGTLVSASFGLMTISNRIWGVRLC